LITLLRRRACRRAGDLTRGVGVRETSRAGCCRLLTVGFAIKHNSIRANRTRVRQTVAAELAVRLMHENDAWSTHRTLPKCQNSFIYGCRRRHFEKCHKIFLTRGHLSRSAVIIIPAALHIFLRLSFSPAIAARLFSRLALSCSEVQFAG